MANYSLTKHAEYRAQQRGIEDKTIFFVIENADLKYRAGSGCRSLQISNRRLKKLRSFERSSQSVERAKGVAVIVSHDNFVLTAMHRKHHARPRVKKWSSKKHQTSVFGPIALEVH